jgi:hypothetical protein
MNLLPILAILIFGTFVLIESMHLQGHQERPCVHRGDDADF